MKGENGENCCRNDGVTGTKKRTGAKAQGQGTATAKRMGVYPEERQWNTVSGHKGRQVARCPKGAHGSSLLISSMFVVK